MGYAGNVEPSHIIPTALADHLDKVFLGRKSIFTRKNRETFKSVNCNMTNLISTLVIML